MSARRRRHALRQLQREISQRSPENLIPLSSAGYPAELLPVVAASNDLLTRLGAAYAAQQRLQAEAAHELRTPLTALRLHAQLAAGETEPQTRDAALQQVQMAVDRATRLVDQWLDLARFDPCVAASQQKSQQNIAVNLLELAKNVVLEHAILAEANDVDLGLLASNGAVFALGDPDALRSMLGNLVLNAIRHTGPGHRVDVSVGVDAGRVYCRVVDDGPGIPEADRAQALQAFRRLGNASKPGSGLGLAIVHQVVLQHAGRLEMTDAPGGGLSVNVLLPAPDKPYSS